MPSNGERGERPPADFFADVAEPKTIEAEERVLAYLRGRGWPCIDVRRRNAAWDFELYAGERRQRIDVKCDAYLDTTARLPFEDRHVFNDGSIKPGWGWSPDLDIVAVVGRDTSRCVFVRLPEFRALVEREQVPTRGCAPDWKRIDRENVNKRTQGWAAPLGLLFQVGAIWHVAALPKGWL